MKYENIRNVLNKRKGTDNNWGEGIEECWKEEINIICSDISTATNFLKEECSGEEYVLISEVLIDVIDKTKNADFLTAYKGLSVKYSDLTTQYYISDFIKDAETIICSTSDLVNRS